MHSTAEQVQVSEELSDSPSDTKPYDIRDEKVKTDECVVHVLKILKTRSGCFAPPMTRIHLR